MRALGPPRLVADCGGCAPASSADRETTSSGALREEGERALREKYEQYRDTDFAQLVYLDVTSLVGWSAERTDGSDQTTLS